MRLATITAMYSGIVAGGFELLPGWLFIVVSYLCVFEP